MKVVGTRRFNLRGKDALEQVDKLQRLAMRLRKDSPFYPAGIYRFSSFEEKASWRLRMLTASRRESRQ